MTPNQILLDVLLNCSLHGIINLETLREFAADLKDKTAVRRLTALMDHVRDRQAASTIPERQLQFLNDIYRQLIGTLAILKNIGMISLITNLADEHDYHLNAIEARAATIRDTPIK
jgi:hypothetical protein